MTGRVALVPTVGPSVRSFPLYWRTVRHLQPAQVLHQVRRRVWPPRPPASWQPLGPLRAVEVARLATARFVVTPHGASTDEALYFLNDPRPLRCEAPDWVSAAAPKLWRYNIHYFDYLQWPVLATATKIRLVEDWIERVPVGAVDAWEPYTLSLRIVNWLKFFLTLPAVPGRWLENLGHQVAALAADVEYHLRANHLLKNGKALLFAGVLCDGPGAARSREAGSRIVGAEVREQFLPDGGHFERSPMYHCIALEDLLDMAALARAVPGCVPGDLEETVRSTATLAAGFLADLVGGDGEIALFNDSAVGIAPSPGKLLAYAADTVGWTAPVFPGGSRRVERRETGYFGYSQDGESLLVDCGPVGPDYQPGHAHCDTLSYELCIAGRRLVVDSGVFSYQDDERRHALRSTRAHNTVVVDSTEQSEVWSAFRVGRRARPIAASLSGGGDGPMVFDGAHDGYRHLPDRPVHRRRILMQPGGPWEVLDVISGGSGRSHSVQSLVHLAPEVRSRQIGPLEVELELADGGGLLQLTASPGSNLRLLPGYYCPAFGVCLENQLIEISREGQLPLELGYRLEYR